MHRWDDWLLYNGPTLTSGDVRYRAGIGGIADINGV
jgi:hypothetical protein